MCRKNFRDFKERTCTLLNHQPYVCNGCTKRAHCRISKYYYRAKDANKEYTEFKSEARIGIRLSQEEIYNINKLKNSIKVLIMFLLIIQIYFIFQSQHFILMLI